MTKSHFVLEKLHPVHHKKCKILYYPNHNNYTIIIFYLYTVYAPIYYYNELLEYTHNYLPQITKLIIASLVTKINVLIFNIVI